MGSIDVAKNMINVAKLYCNVDVVKFHVISPMATSSWILDAFYDLAISENLKAKFLTTGWVNIRNWYIAIIYEYLLMSQNIL